MIKKIQFLLIFVTFSIYLIGSLGTPICFSDCGGYVYLMGERIFSFTYLDKLFSLGSRPWFVPFFYSLFSDYSLTAAMQITIYQTLIAFCSWLYFSHSVQKSINGGFLILFVFMLQMFGQGYMMFNKYLLSDSLSLSLVLIYLAIIFELELPAKFTSIRVFMLVVVGTFCIGARDSNKLIVLAGIAYLWLSISVSISMFKVKPLIIATITIITAISVQLPYSQKRHEENMINVIAGFVLPEAQARNFFLENGMPRNLIEKSADFKKQDFSKVNLSEMFVYREVVKSVGSEYLKDASGVYLKFMLTHPNFLFDVFVKNRDVMLNQNWNKDGLGGYEKLGNVIFWPEPQSLVPVISQSPIKLSFVDKIPLNFKFLLLIMATIVFLKNPKREYFKFLFLQYLGLFTAFLSFVGDLWEVGEMARHALVGSVLFNIGFLGLFLMLFIRLKSNYFNNPTGRL